MTNVEDLMWEEASGKLFIDKDQFLEGLRMFAIELVENDGVLVVAWLRRGPELHMWTPKSGKPIPRRILADALVQQFAQYGYVDVVTPKRDRRQRRFNEAIGFVATGEDEYNIHYRLERDRSVLSRSAPCPS